MNYLLLFLLLLALPGELSAIINAEGLGVAADRNA